MVNCPHCGTANQDGSEFCRECGQPLSTQNPLLSQDGSGDISEEMPAWLEELLVAQGLKPEAEEPEPRPAGWPDASLLEGEPEEPAPVTEAEPEDWLATLRSRGDEPSPEEDVPLPTDEDDFDWLRGLRESDSEVESRGEPPEWLRDLGGPGEEVTGDPPSGTGAPPAETDAPSFEMPEAGDEELPEWLRDLGGPGEVPETPAAGLPVEGTGEAEGEKGPGAEMLQWLQEVQREEPIPAEEEGLPPDGLAQPTTSDASVETDEAPIPEWLKGPPSSPGDVVVEEKESAPPDWLQEVSAALPHEAEAETLSSAEVPSWLQELRPSAETPGPAVEEETPLSEEKGQEEDLEPLPPEAPVEETDKPAGEPEEGGEGLVAADIPDWLLSLRPGKEGEEPPGEPELMELSGPLAGIRGVLPVEPLISFPHLTRPEKVPVKVPAVSGDLLAEVVAQPPVQAAPVPRRKDERIVAGVQRVLIYLLVLAAVVVPLLMGPIYGPLDAVDLMGGAETFYPLLDGRGAVALPSGSVVVVAFDYKPAMAAELSLQARAILDHLMRRGVRIMAISLYPEGAALASDILDELAAAHGYAYGENYIHLGYLPDQPASVRYFLNAGPAGNGWKDYREGQPVSQYPIAQGVGNLSAVRLVIELAGNERTLQTWVEQMSVRTRVPLAAGVSAATLPYAQPYLDSGQLRALLVGLPGAAEYEARIGRAGDATDSLGSQVAAQASIVLLILLGNLVHLVSRGGKK